MYAETIGNEVYVYRNGELIYKKWLKQNNSVVLNNPPNWKHDKTFNTKERLALPPHLILILLSLPRVLALTAPCAVL